MISKGNSGYWATGIVVRCDGQGRWGGRVSFYDDGFADDEADVGQISTEGTLWTRYHVADGNHVPALRVVVDTLLADATRLGVKFGVAGASPALMYEGDGEDAEWPPPDGWRLDGPTITHTSRHTVHAGQIVLVDGDRVVWQHPGWYDDYRTTEATVTDPELVARVKALIAAGDRRRGPYRIEGSGQTAGPDVL